LWLLYWGSKLIKGVFHLDISFICWFRVFVAEEVDGTGDKGSEDTTVDIQMLLEVFLNLSLRCACLSGEAFFW